mgnify:CR=1 FL=1
MSKIREAELIDTDCLHPRKWNPNVMSDEKFNQLVEKIDEEDFTDPVKAYPMSKEDMETNGWNDGREHHWIWAGEHRWRYCRIKQMPQVPTVVYRDKEWNENQQKMKMVRDNLIHGDLDAKKFTELARSIDGNFDIDPKMFGFSDQTEMDKFLIKEKNTAERSFLDGFLESANQQKEAVDALSDIVSNIFAQCAGTIDQSYLHFTYKGNLHCVVLCKPETKKQVDDMLKHVQATGGDINVFMEQAIREGLIRVAE